MRTSLSPLRLSLAFLLLLSACGSRTTVLSASGLFTDLQVQDFDTTKQRDGSLLVRVALESKDSAEMRLVLRPGDAQCWRSQDNQHACTSRIPPGSIDDDATLRLKGASCEVLGWMEDLGGAWQVDLEVTASEACAEGHLVATIEP